MNVAYLAIVKEQFTSHFKDPLTDLAWLTSWSADLERQNNRSYTRTTVKTSLGNTHVWSMNDRDASMEALVIFPGARTSVLFWDFDRNLDHLGPDLRIFLVETNGLPNLSDGTSPDIKGLGYGQWASDVLEQLNIKKAYVAGASFGGLIAMKLAMVSPEKIKAAFLLNPGCLQPFSLTLKNLYYNLLPIIAPSAKNVLTFLDNAVFCKPNHQLSPAAEKLIVDYEVFALTRYKDNTQKPYFMADELRRANADTYLLVGDKDLLFPFQKSIIHARSLLPKLIDVSVFPQVGHGIETYGPALTFIKGAILRRA